MGRKNVRFKTGDKIWYLTTGAEGRILELNEAVVLRANNKGRSFSLAGHIAPIPSESCFGSKDEAILFIKRSYMEAIEHHRNKIITLNQLLDELPSL